MKYMNAVLGVFFAMALWWGASDIVYASSGADEAEATSGASSTIEDEEVPTALPDRNTSSDGPLLPIVVGANIAVVSVLAITVVLAVRRRDAGEAGNTCDRS
jgi:hypothetical protein